LFSELLNNLLLLLLLFFDVPVGNAHIGEQYSEQMRILAPFCS